MRSQTVQFDKKRLAIFAKIGGNILKLMEGHKPYIGKKNMLKA